MNGGLKRSAVLCILRSQDALLLIHRAQEPNLGKFIPIGGKLDPYETPRDAAFREVREEAGLTLASPETLHFCGVLIETSPTAYNWISFVYAAHVPRFEPPLCREGRMEWVPIDTLADIPTPATDMAIYHYVLMGQPFVLDAVWSQDLELLAMREELSGVPLLRQTAHERDPKGAGLAP